LKDDRKRGKSQTNLNPLLGKPFEFLVVEVVEVVLDIFLVGAGAERMVCGGGGTGQL
jgi:hypothetical protein